MRVKKPSEKTFMRAVVQYATLHRFTVYHTFDSRRSDEGFPDLVFRRNGRVALVAELKTETGAASAEQLAWLEAFRGAGVPAYLWTPADWDEIERVLGGAP